MAGLPAFTPALPIIILVWRIRALIRRFHDLNAISPESAVAFETLGARRSLIFRRLVHKGVIGKTGEDHYYLDASRYQQWRTARRRRALVALAVLIAAFMAAWLAGWL